MTDPNAIQPSELDQLPDRDPEETAEWQASLDAVAAAAGPHRAAYLMRRTLERAEGARRRAAQAARDRLRQHHPHRG